MLTPSTQHTLQHWRSTSTIAPPRWHKHSLVLSASEKERLVFMSGISPSTNESSFFHYNSSVIINLYPILNSQDCPSDVIHIPPANRRIPDWFLMEHAYFNIAGKTLSTQRVDLPAQCPNYVVAKYGWLSLWEIYLKIVKHKALKDCIAKFWFF